jgi:ferredoxin
VGLNRDLCIGCKNCTAACPFEVPKYDAGTDKVYKRDMCESRLANNMTPACVKACPTGALSWGDKEAQLKKAAARAKDLGGSATVYGDKYVGGTHLMYVLSEKPATYAGIQIDPCVPLSVTLWRGFLKPVSLLAAGGILVGSSLHYLIHGPKLPDEPGDAGKKEGGE